MGKILNILSSIKSAFKPMYSCVRLESAECVHFHWKNLRFLLNYEQLETLSRCTNRGYEILKIIGYVKRNGNGIVLDEVDMPHSDNYENDDIFVEQNEESVIHVHYRGLRIELKNEEFLEFADCLTFAAQNLRKLK